MSDVDWGVVATVTVIAKGAWDIYKERRKPALDLSTLEANVAQAANISVRSLLEATAHMQKRIDELGKSERIIRTDLQDMGQRLGQIRTVRDRQRVIISKLFLMIQNYIMHLEQLNQPTEEMKKQIKALQDEVAHIGSGPL